MTTYSWMTGTSGDWNTGTNWAGVFRTMSSRLERPMS